MRPVEITGIHIEANTGAPLVLLRELEEPHRVLPIFLGGPEATAIALALSGEAPPRPLTHDVMAALVQSLDAHLDAVEVTHVDDGAFRAELAVSGPGGGRRLDTRPSDAIALAVRLDTPLFVSDAVLEQAGTVVTAEPEAADTSDPSAAEEPAGAPDPQAIEDTVAEFASFLDQVDPADFQREGTDGPEA